MPALLPVSTSLDLRMRWMNKIGGVGTDVLLLAFDPWDGSATRAEQDLGPFQPGGAPAEEPLDRELLRDHRSHPTGRCLPRDRQGQGWSWVLVGRKGGSIAVWSGLGTLIEVEGRRPSTDIIRRLHE